MTALRKIHYNPSFALSDVVDSLPRDQLIKLIRAKRIAQATGETQVITSIPGRYIEAHKSGRFVDINSIRLAKKLVGKIDNDK